MERRMISLDELNVFNLALDLQQEFFTLTKCFPWKTAIPLPIRFGVPPVSFIEAYPKLGKKDATLVISSASSSLYSSPVFATYPKGLLRSTRRR